MINQKHKNNKRLMVLLEFQNYDKKIQCVFIILSNAYIYIYIYGGYSWEKV